MPYVVNMPKLGLEMEEGTVLEWKVDREDEVEEGKVIAEIESEKSIGEVEAREDGVLRRIYVEVDETVQPGTPIGIVAGAEEDIDDLESAALRELEAATGETPADDAVEDTAEGTSTGPTASESAASEATTSAQSRSTSVDDVKASPRAKKRAEELGVDFTTVEGTGPQGSITEDDVESAASRSASESESEREGAADVKASPRAKKRAEELGVDLTTVAGTGPQASITEDDVTSAAEAAEEEAIESGGGTGAEVGGELESRSRGQAVRIVPDRTEQYRYERTTAVLDVDAAEAVFDAKRAAENALEMDVTVIDVLLVVLAETLRDVPEVNATFEESTHHLHESQHVALAAPDAAGLATRVVPDLDERTFTDLVAARRETGDGGRGRDDGPTPTFTVANASDFDEGAVGKIVNSPAVAALEVDTVGQRAVPTENGVDLRSHVTCGVTYDTRAADRSVVERFFDSLEENARDATDLVMKTYVK